MAKTTGFASPAQGYEDNIIDLNGLLIKNPPATFFFKLESEDMTALGLPKGALLVVDRSRNAKKGDFVLIAHEGRFLCRLMAENEGKIIFSDSITKIQPIADDTAIIGVVTSATQVFGYDNAR